MEKLNSWHISQGLLNWICTNIKKNSIILELGSGYGSSVLASNGYEVHSVEHSDKYLYKYKNVIYINAPLKEHKQVDGFEGTMWYDKEVIAKISHDYKMIIVDGPPGNYGRAGFLKYLGLFDTTVPIAFDDIHRQRDYKLAIKVSAKLKRPLTVWDAWNADKHWGIV